MNILLAIYGIAIIALALVVVGLVYRLMSLEAVLAGPREPTLPTPDLVSSKIDEKNSHHLLIVVDDSCSICHRTVKYLSDEAERDPQLSDLVTVLANAAVFESRGIPIVVDPEEHRRLHQGWAPAGLVFSAQGLVEAVPVGSTESVDFAVERLSFLAAIPA